MDSNTPNDLTTRAERTMSEKHPEFKSERREKKRDRRRFHSNGRPEYLRLQVGRILRVLDKKRRA